MEGAPIAADLFYLHSKIGGRDQLCLDRGCEPRLLDEVLPAGRHEAVVLWSIARVRIQRFRIAMNQDRVSGTTEVATWPHRWYFEVRHRPPRVEDFPAVLFLLLPSTGKPALLLRHFKFILYAIFGPVPCQSGRHSVSQQISEAISPSVSWSE